MTEYRVDLRDLFVPGSGVTPGWLLMLISELPTASRFFAERRGGRQFRGWDEGRYATVAIVNAIRALQFTYIYAHAKSKPKPPEPFPLPERTTTQRQAAKPGSFANLALTQLAKKKQRRAK